MLNISSIVAASRFVRSCTICGGRWIGQ